MSARPSVPECIQSISIRLGSGSSEKIRNFHIFYREIAENRFPGIFRKFKLIPLKFSKHFVGFKRIGYFKRIFFYKLILLLQLFVDSECLSHKIKSIKVANPFFETLETGKMGHMLPEGIKSATFCNSYNDEKINYIFRSFIFNQHWKFV